jgi:hypothetical protein
MNWIAELFSATASPPSRGRIGPLDPDIIVDPMQQAAWDADLAALAALANGGWKRNGAGTRVAKQRVIVTREIGRQKARRLPQPHTGDREKFGEQSVTLAVMAAPGGAADPSGKWARRPTSLNRTNRSRPMKRMSCRRAAGSRKERERRCASRGVLCLGAAIALRETVLWQ